MKVIIKYIAYARETYRCNMFYRRFYKADISPFANLDIKSFRGYLERNEEDAGSN